MVRAIPDQHGSTYYRVDDAYISSLQRALLRDGVKVSREVLVVAQQGLSRGDARQVLKATTGGGIDNTKWAAIQRTRKAVSGIPVRGPGSRPAPPPGEKRDRIMEASYLLGGSRAATRKIVRATTGQGLPDREWTRIRREAAAKAGDATPRRGATRTRAAPPGRTGRGIGELPSRPSRPADTPQPAQPPPPPPAPESIFAGIPFNPDGSVDFILRMRDKKGQEYAQTVRLERGGIMNIAKAYRKEAEWLARIRDSPDLMDRFDFQAAEDWEFLPPLPI